MGRIDQSHRGKERLPSNPKYPARYSHHRISTPSQSRNPGPEIDSKITHIDAQPVLFNTQCYRNLAQQPLQNPITPNFLYPQNRRTPLQSVNCSSHFVVVEAILNYA